MTSGNLVSRPAGAIPARSRVSPPGPVASLAARPEPHLAQALAQLDRALAASARIVGTESQANDLYIAGRGALARAQELRLIDEPEAAALDAGLESARRACYRCDEVPCDKAAA